MQSNAPSRNERRQQHTRSMPRATRTESEWSQTGAFTGVGRPKVVGVSEVVALSNRRLASSARRAERAWLRTLPKGVRV
jgi:hypothetical protein